MRKLVAVCFGIALSLAHVTALAQSLSDRQVLATFAAGTVAMSDEADSVDVAKAITPESDLSTILPSFGIQEIARAFPDFDRADTLGVTYTGDVVRLTDWSKVYLLTVPVGTNPDDLISALLTTPSTVIAERNGTGIGFSTPQYPNDPYLKFGSQRGVWTPIQSGGPDTDVDAVWAWGVTTGSPFSNIGIIDGGFTGSHQDLGSRVTSTTGESSTANHAYHVAGVAGAQTDNGIGIAGIDWKAGLKSRLGGNKQSDQTTINAVTQLSPANTGNCRVLNASWGLVTTPNELPRYSIYVEAAFKDHYTRTGTTVAAMGNRGLGGLRDYPANYQFGVVSVGACDSLDNRWPGSSTSPRIDLVAPGVDVWTTDSTGTYVQDTGTSISAAFVSGAASLLYAKRADLTPNDVEHILRYTAQDIPPANTLPADVNIPATPADTLTGAGRLNISRALHFLDPPNRFEKFSKAVPPQRVTIGSASSLGPTTVFSVPGLPDSIYDGIEVYPVTCTLTFQECGIGNFTTPPKMWGNGAGAFTTGWLNFLNIGGPRLITDYRYCYVTDVSTTGFTVHTYIYWIPAEDQQWFPIAPNNTFQFALTAVQVAPIPDPSNSYYVPQVDGVATPTEGADAVKFFRACPNNDGDASLPPQKSPRIKVVLRDAANAPIAGVSPADVLVLLNGATPGQGFVGDGADSIIASHALNFGGNGLPSCPDLRALPADASTDAMGTTYITFTGSKSNEPGVGERDPSRKWGHYDSKLPVYALAIPLQGRLTTGSANGSYVLQIKSFDFRGGLSNSSNQGEAVTAIDFNNHFAHSNNEPDSADAENWWRDFDSSGFVTGIDFNMLVQHMTHDCATPNNP